MKARKGKQKTFRVVWCGIRMKVTCQVEESSYSFILDKSMKSVLVHPSLWEHLERLDKLVGTLRMRKITEDLSPAQNRKYQAEFEQVMRRIMEGEVQP